MLHFPVFVSLGVLHNMLLGIGHLTVLVGIWLQIGSYLHRQALWFIIFGIQLTRSRIPLASKFDAPRPV